jgi:hypothetical protein
VPHPQES